MLNLNNVLNFNTLHYFFKYAKKPYSIKKNKQKLVNSYSIVIKKLSKHIAKEIALCYHIIS